jgi:glycosyltransferase involved in cell wall biosynthesis
MMRTLLFYTHALAGGGAERVWARLASGFHERGDRVLFVVDAADAQETRKFLAPGVDLVILPRGHGPAVAALAKLLRQEKPDASLSALSVSNLKHFAAAALAGRLSHAIISYHGFYESETALLSNIGYRLTPLFSRSAGATVAVSDALRGDLIKRFFAPPGCITTIYNPGAPEPFPAEVTSDELMARPPVVLAMGRLVPDKDFVTLVRAFALVENTDAQLIILGEGPERARIEAEVRNLNVEHRVVMPGFVDNIGGPLMRAKCVVISSLRETFGLSCVEGMAYGLPIVATDCGGPSEVLGPASPYPLTKPGDARALAHRIEATLANPGDPAARQKRAHSFSLDAALDAYDTLIRKFARCRVEASMQDAAPALGSARLQTESRNDKSK